MGEHWCQWATTSQCILHSSSPANSWVFLQGQLFGTIVNIIAVHPHLSSAANSWVFLQGQKYLQSCDLKKRQKEGHVQVKSQATWESLKLLSWKLCIQSFNAIELNETEAQLNSIDNTTLQNSIQEYYKTYRNTT